MRIVILAAALALSPLAAKADTATAVFAGGCFWCVESDFDKLDGVSETVSGYSGGTLTNPTYREVTSQDTGHYEVVQITYDPEVVSYGELVEYLLRHVDPTDAGGQFCDRGPSYRTAIFAASEEEEEAARTVIERLEASVDLPGPIVTPVLDAAPFWRAEEYHQDYYLKNPIRYTFYRLRCGRDARVEAVWGG
ncbi:MAG: peptide-methionine (S)-S-oxide reductase MsrA [Rubricella sp.]